jgi:acetate---CoA ligase (ADP-forming)
MKNLDAILSPKSIAVVGATNRTNSIGLAVFTNILKGGYRGVLYPVHPTAASVSSVRAYPTLLDIPDAVDMAVIIVPAPMVSSVIDQAAEKGVKGLVVITGGFKEVGAEGKQLERQVVRQIHAHGIHMVGPNCLGVINTALDASMNASFSQRMPTHGNIAFISQSGALCTAVLDYAEARNIGFSKFISFGNKADINEIDLLKYLRDDPETEVIAMYLEDITDGREFIDTAREIIWETHKPMLAIKSGRSAEGAKAAASHTGSLAGSDIAYDCILNQSGILRVDTMNELFDSAFAFAHQPVPRGRRIGIVTNAGGPGIMATDSAVRHGLELAAFSETTKAAIRKNVSPMANISNPVDTIGYAYHEQFEAVIRAVIQDDNVDGAIVMLTPAAITDILETAQIIPNVTRDTDKPILCSFMGVVDVSEGMAYLQRHGVPVYNFPENPVRAMANMAEFGWLLTVKNKEVRRVAADKESVCQIIDAKLAGADRYMMTQKEANEILQCYGFPMLKGRLLKTREEIADAAEEVMFPVAMKISSPDILHKYDAGGVLLDIKDQAEAERAFDTIIANAWAFNADARIQGVLMERMARKGVEVILGATRDPKFGPVCMFGLGGTFVEALKDVTFRVAPMWEVSAEMMIREIKAYTVLTGIRNRPPSDIAAIKDCVLRLSQLVSDHPEIDELDINPLIVYAEGEGCVVADSRIVLSRVPERISVTDDLA